MKIQDKDLQGIWQAVSNLHVVNKPGDAPFAARDGNFSTGENFMWGVSNEKPEEGMWAISCDSTGFTISSEDDEGMWFVDVTSPNHAIKLILNGEFFKALFS